MNSSLESIIEEIRAERAAQDRKWGEQNHHPYKWLAILHEETGEAAQALLDGSEENYRKEMVQVAAVALSMIESLDRGKWREKR